MGYPIHGKVSEMTVDGASANQVADLTDWEINTNLDTEESTVFQDDWKTYIVGTAGWTGSASGYFNPLDTYQKELMDLIVAATPTGLLSDGRWQLEDSADYYSGSVIVTQMGTPVTISGIVKITFAFLGTGALTLTIA